MEAEPPVEEVKQEDVAAVAEPVTELKLNLSLLSNGSGALLTGKVRLKPEGCLWLLLPLSVPELIRYPNWKNAIPGGSRSEIN